LSDLFKLTEPTCEEYERIKFHLGPDTIYWDAFETPEGRYEYSLWGRLEEYLSDTEQFSLKVME